MALHAALPGRQVEIECVLSAGCQVETVALDTARLQHPSASVCKLVIAHAARHNRRVATVTPDTAERRPGADASSKLPRLPLSPVKPPRPSRPAEHADGHVVMIVHTARPSRRTSTLDTAPPPHGGGAPHSMPHPQRPTQLSNITAPAQQTATPRLLRRGFCATRPGRRHARLIRTVVPGSTRPQHGASAASQARRPCRPDIFAASKLPRLFSRGLQRRMLGSSVPSPPPRRDGHA